MRDEAEQARPVRIGGARGREAEAHAGLKQEPAEGDGDEAEDPGRQEAGIGHPAFADDQGEDDAVDDADRVVRDPAERLLVDIGRGDGDAVVKDLAVAKMEEPAADRRPVRLALAGKAREELSPEVEEDGRAEAEDHALEE